MLRQAAALFVLVASPDRDEEFMRLALKEAQKALGRTTPNPAVGALLVANGKIIARAHHRRAGAPHAEIECLERARGRMSKDATLYVTLEPCSTVGRTGRCTDAIVAAGIKRVVIGTIDLNPRHDGRGATRLRAAGVEVRAGVLEDACREINEAFNKWIVTGVPFVVAKCGMSLDGRLCRPPNESQWITSAQARRDAHQLRSQVDAILVGAETARRDNPRLNVRGIKGARQPWRVILTRSGRLPKNLKLLCDAENARTMVYRQKSLGAVLRDLGKKNITSVLIEGGGRVLGQALDQRLIDKVQVYLAPMMTGGEVLAFAGKGAGSTREGLRLREVSYQRVGPDLRVTGYPAAAGAGSE